MGWGTHVVNWPLESSPHPLNDLQAPPFQGLFFLRKTLHWPWRVWCPQLTDGETVWREDGRQEVMDSSGRGPAARKPRGGG